MTDETVKQTAQEISESLNGFEEIAISKAFGDSIDELSGSLPARALVFVLNKRQGMNDAAAHQSSMELTMRELEDAFEEDPDEPMPDEPITAAGKGDEPTG